MRLIDLDDPRVVHLLGNLEPKWKPMAEFGNGELLHELSGIAEAFEKLTITDMSAVSDGYHTFNSLYHQRLILTAALACAFPNLAWKSRKHSDGEVPFGGGWFIVGFATPEGQYTYHYEDKDWDLFQCPEVEKAPEWDGHTDKDVRRLLSLTKKDESSQSEWAAKEIELAIASEKQAADGKDDWQYGAACYESALRAYRDLASGHDAFDIQVIKSILNRLIDGRTLTPIEDTDDIWNEISRKEGIHEYQCRRMSSLFKKVDKDGIVTYKDIDRVYGVNIDSPDVRYQGAFLTELIDKIFPITMPYLPSTKRFCVTCDEFLVDPKNGDYDTVGYLDILTPGGETIKLNRYFKEENGKMVLIEKAEFDERKAKRVEAPKNGSKS